MFDLLRETITKDSEITVLTFQEKQLQKTAKLSVNLLSETITKDSEITVLTF